jgi:hypothetical protein
VRPRQPGCQPVPLAKRGGCGRLDGPVHAFRTNSDNASCTTSSFSLTKVVPSGWTGTFSPTSLSLAPGATGTATLSVHSATTAANGSYSITATAKNSGATTFTSTASATYVVANPCVRANPTISLTPSQSAGVAAGTAVAFTLRDERRQQLRTALLPLTNTVPAG